MREEHGDIYPSQQADWARRPYSPSCVVHSAERSSGWQVIKLKMSSVQDSPE